MGPSWFQEGRWRRARFVRPRDAPSFGLSVPLLGCPSAMWWIGCGTMNDRRRDPIRPHLLLPALGLMLILFAACRDQAVPNGGVEAASDGGGSPPSPSSPLQPGRPGAPLVEEAVVGLPVYPGLELVSRAEGGDAGDGVVTLPAIIGHTSDPMEKVVAFYEERLSDWNRMEAHGSEIFWKGDPEEGHDPLSREAMTRPSVSVMPPIREGAPVRVQYIYER